MRVVALITGLLMAAAYARLHQAIVFRSELGKSFLLINPRESLFWLSHYLLLVPGLLLVAWATAPWWARRFEALRRRLQERTRQGSDVELSPGLRDGLLVAGFALFLVFGAVVGRTLFLLDLPVTNDEYTILFGARILLEGEVTAPDIDPAYAFPMPWVFRHEGRIASMDFPGTILLTALALASGLGKHLFFLLSAISAAALVLLCRRLDGRPGLWAAMVFWGLSPMVWTLSLTLHSHLVSRSFVALAFALYGWAVLRRDLGPRAAVALGVGLGLSAAGGFVSRPAEVATVLAPVGLDLLLRALRGGRTERTLAGTAALASLAGPALMAWWNLKTTGVWHLSARVLVNPSLDDPLWPAAWERLGENLGFNLMMLILWFLGPLAVALVVLALEEGSRIAKVCGAAVACQLLMALLHDSTGIRLVGPIHYSEAAVPLLILSVLGLRRARELLDRWSVRPATPTVLLAFYLGSLVVWSGIHTETLVDQARIHRAPLDAVAHLEDAVVVADRPSELWFSRPELEDVSSWLADLPHPDPYLRDSVLFAYPEADLDLLRRDFPDRRFYRMTYHPEGELVRVVPLPP